MTGLPEVKTGASGVMETEPTIATKIMAESMVETPGKHPRQVSDAAVKKKTCRGQITVKTLVTSRR